ncbi:hypothetical protein BD310DRAFT_981845 [Dichomitus squalens]|uniref:Uncharacterized protein n=1 Tax=Dichomitus squalens TaxID=114155 RepID=A0A4Q9PHN7_9APHY|nr:hypothetical protein BD310DRAFT_981845 [Dichomitus squalens]
MVSPSGVVPAVLAPPREQVGKEDGDKHGIGQNLKGWLKAQGAKGTAKRAQECAEKIFLPHCH